MPYPYDDLPAQIPTTTVAVPGQQQLPLAPVNRPPVGYQNPGAGLNFGIGGSGQMPPLNGAPGGAQPRPSSTPPPPLPGANFGVSPPSAQTQNPDGSVSVFPAAQNNQTNQSLRDFLNGGGQLPANTAVPASAFAGGPIPPGWRPTLGADYFERDSGPGVNPRNGDSLAEVQAMHPGWDITRQYQMAQALQQQNMQNAVGNNALVNDTRNRNFGIMSTPNAISQQNANALTQQTAFNTSQDRARDQVRQGIIANGGGIQEVQEALAAFDAGNGGPRVTGQQMGGPAGARPVIGQAPPAVVAPADIHRQLDQHLRTALTSSGVALPPEAARGPGAPRTQLTMPATTDPAIADTAITNFVHAANTNGGLGQNITQIMPYMVQRFGPQAVDRWFAQRRFGGRQLTPHQQAIDMISNAANAAHQQQNPGAGPLVGQVNSTNTSALNARNWPLIGSLFN